MRVKALFQVIEIFRIFKYHCIEFYYFSSNWLLDQRILIPLCILFIILYPTRVLRQEFPTFRVVIDPGHGGVGRNPMSIHGDRYDAISGKYLDSFKYGAALGKLREHEIAYDIAIKVEKYLRYLSPGAPHNKFYEILEKYSDEPPSNIDVLTYLSRDKSIAEEKADSLDDPNGPFRLFDYPDRDGGISPGRLSRINAVRPHLVVSLHMAESGPRDYAGINPVITPAHDLLRNGLLYLKGDSSRKKIYKNSSYRDWFVESDTRSEFDWFLNDASLYFTGYPLRKNLEIDRSGFKGYRYNMVRWAYSDIQGWQYPARYHLPATKYSTSFKDFVPSGKFWDRERSKYESFRRDGGPEGYGGDNAYASYEIVRYMLYSLALHGNDYRTQKPGKSYMSVWIVPLHVNAVSAFLELGYLNRPRDRYLLTRKQEELAEGIAVGIYSLLSGLRVKDKKYRYAPRGKKLNLDKYRTGGEESYFDAVIEE